MLFTGYVLSYNRVISGTSDNWYLSIRNSNGKCWEATTSNIQVAINDLDNHSGVVELPGNKTFWITNTIVVWRNVTLDMCGAEFRLPNGTDCIVVELKDGSAIKNGNIDVSGHQSLSPPYEYQVNTTFCNGGQKAIIFLNASSCINSALIWYMTVESSSFNNDSTPWDMRTYDSGYNARGYGVHLYASDTDVPQWIRNVTVKHCYFRICQDAIFIQNERNDTGTNAAHIDENTFESLWLSSCHEHINISRNTDATRDNCSVDRNYFNNIQMLVGESSWYGGEQVTWHFVVVSGYGNIFRNIFTWDASSSFRRGNGPVINLTSDSSHCFIHGRGLCYENTSLWKNYGDNNTVISIGYGDLEVGDIFEEE